MVLKGYTPIEKTGGQQLECLGTGRLAATDDLREFLLVLRRALLMVCRYIEHRYNLTVD